MRDVVCVCLGVVLFDEFCSWALSQHLEHIEEAQRQQQLAIASRRQAQPQRRRRQGSQGLQRRLELEPLRKRLVAMSYGNKGAEPANLFSL